MSFGENIVVTADTWFNLFICHILSKLVKRLQHLSRYPNILNMQYFVKRNQVVALVTLWIRIFFTRLLLHKNRMVNFNIRSSFASSFNPYN